MSSLKVCAALRSNAMNHTLYALEKGTRREFGRFYPPRPEWLATQTVESILEPDLPIIDTHFHLVDVPGLQYLGVFVDVGEAKNLPAGEKFLDDLEARIRTYPPELVRSVRTGVGEERAFIKKNAPLYMDLADLKIIHDRIEMSRELAALFDRVRQ